MIPLTASCRKTQKEMVITMDKAKASAVDMLILPDCLALTENGGCSLLKKISAAVRSAAFYTLRRIIDPLFHTGKNVCFLSVMRNRQKYQKNITAA